MSFRRPRGEVAALVGETCVKCGTDCGYPAAWRAVESQADAIRARIKTPYTIEESHAMSSERGRLRNVATLLERVCKRRRGEGVLVVDDPFSGVDLSADKAKLSWARASASPIADIEDMIVAMGASRVKS